MHACAAAMAATQRRPGLPSAEASGLLGLEGSSAMLRAHRTCCQGRVEKRNNPKRSDTPRAPAPACKYSRGGKTTNPKGHVFGMARRQKHSAALTLQ